MYQSIHRSVLNKTAVDVVWSPHQNANDDNISQASYHYIYITTIYYMQFVHTTRLRTSQLAGQQCNIFNNNNIAVTRSIVSSQSFVRPVGNLLVSVYIISLFQSSTRHPRHAGKVWPYIYVLGWRCDRSVRTHYCAITLPPLTTSIVPPPLRRTTTTHYYSTTTTSYYNHYSYHFHCCNYQLLATTVLLPDSITSRHNC